MPGAQMYSGKLNQAFSERELEVDGKRSEGTIPKITLSPPLPSYHLPRSKSISNGDIAWHNHIIPGLRRKEINISNLNQYNINIPPSSAIYSNTPKRRGKQQTSIDIYGSSHIQEPTGSPELQRLDSGYLPEPPPTPENARLTCLQPNFSFLEPALQQHLENYQKAENGTVTEDSYKEYPTKFFLGPPSMSEELSYQQHHHHHNDNHTEKKYSSSSGSGSTPESQCGELRHILRPQSTAEVHRASNKISNPLYQPYWHIPRTALWCSHRSYGRDEKHCNDCQLQDDTSSLCSSIGPTPTFTALDNYRPIGKKNNCECNFVLLITTIFSLTVLLIIAGFVIYIEAVLKHQQAYVPYKI